MPKRERLSIAVVVMIYWGLNPQMLFLMIIRN